RQDWLRCYFNQNYLWYQLSPAPSPAGFNTVDAYFDALLYGGGDPIPGGGGALWPADRYSGYQSTESFNRFFGDGDKNVFKSIQKTQSFGHNPLICLARIGHTRDARSVDFFDGKNANRHFGINNHLQNAPVILVAFIQNRLESLIN
ncbi:MAG: hypothetical protein HC846_04425, partial [Blastocatellia bacterium]|nr:hypothetical protein [Blastocatellia bacterium]